jgi:A nuclease of the HNH/ENDO VII superfamily with conserved WHH
LIVGMVLSSPFAAFFVIALIAQAVSSTFEMDLLPSVAWGAVVLLGLVTFCGVAAALGSFLIRSVAGHVLPSGAPAARRPGRSAVPWKLGLVAAPAILLGVGGFFYGAFLVTDFVVTEQHKRNLVRIPPGVYPLQSYHPSERGFEAVCSQGPVPTFLIEKDPSFSYSPRLLSHASGPMYVRRLENGVETERRKFGDAVGSWIAVEPLNDEYSVAFKRIDPDDKKNHAIQYELVVEDGAPAFLGEDPQRVDAASDFLKTHTRNKDAIKKADAYATKLREVFGPESGVVRAFDRFRLKKLETAWLAKADPSKRVEECIADFGKTVTDPNPQEALCLLSVVHGDALSDQQIQDARQKLGFKLCQSYDEIGKSVRSEGPERFPNMVALARNDEDNAGLLSERRRHLSDVFPAAINHENCPDFAAIVKQLLWTYTNLLGPKITVIREYDQGFGMFREHVWEYLIEWFYSKAEAFLDAVLANYRSGNKADPPCKRLQAAINQGETRAGSPRFTDPNFVGPLTQEQHYARAVLSNRPWSWVTDIPGGADLTAAQRAAIRQNALAQGLIPKVPVKPGTEFPDFEAAGLVKRVDTLPQFLWTAPDRDQFRWLDDRIPDGRPVGMTWHHSEIPGRMELVPFGPHNVTPHIGGRSPGMWADAPR